MKNRFILAAVLLCAATVLGWSQFYQDYDDATRKSLAEATWLAGKQYQAVGKTAKGAEYVEMAFHIWPDLDTSSISDIALPSAAELLAQGGARLIAAPADEQSAARTLSSFFLRFVAALLDEDAPAAAGFLDGSVYLRGKAERYTEPSRNPATAGASRSSSAPTNRRKNEFSACVEESSAPAPIGLRSPRREQLRGRGLLLLGDGSRVERGIDQAAECLVLATLLDLPDHLVLPPASQYDSPRVRLSASLKSFQNCDQRSPEPATSRRTETNSLFLILCLRARDLVPTITARS